MPPRLGPGRGPPPPCCPQCGLRIFPGGPPPPPRGGVGHKNDPRGGMGGRHYPRGGMGGRNNPPRPFMGPRRHFAGRGMPPRPGMWWVGRGPPPPRSGMSRGGMRGGYGRGRGHGGRCFCHATGPRGGPPLPQPGGVIGPTPPGRGVDGRGLGLGPSPGHDQPSAAMSWAKPAARPKDGGGLAQPDRVSRSASAPNKLVGMLTDNPSHKEDVPAKAASIQAESAMSPSAKPRSAETARTAASQTGFDGASIDQGGPMVEGGMPNGEPKAARAVGTDRTRPEDSIAESPLPDAVGLPDRLQHAVTRSATALTSAAKEQRDNDTTRTVADGPTDDPDRPQDVARLNATTGAGASCREAAAAATTSGHADGGASTGVVDVGSSTASPECEAFKKEAPIAEGHGGSRELTRPSEGDAAAARSAPPLSVEDVLKAALEGKCIVWVGGGEAVAAAPGGWLVAAITPEILAPRKTDNDTVNVAQIEHDGRHSPRKVDNNKVDVGQTGHHEEEPPTLATSCTQWEESDVESAPKVLGRTISQLWASKKTPTATSGPVVVEAKDKPATEKPDTKKAAVKEGGQDWTNDVQTEAPARSVLGREKGVLRPVAVASGPEDRHTCSTLGTQTGVERDQDAVLGSRSALGLQTDAESDRGAVLGGVEGGHPLMVSRKTQTEGGLPLWDRRWNPGCDHHEALPEVGRGCSPAAGGGAAEQKNPGADGTPPDRVLASSGEERGGVAPRGTLAKQSWDARGGLEKLDQTVGPTFTLAPGAEGPAGTGSVNRLTVTTDRLPTSARTRTSPNKSRHPTKEPREPTKLNPNQASGRQRQQQQQQQQQQSSMARGILSWALAQRQETDDQHDVSTNAAPDTSRPSFGLDGGVSARELSPLEVVKAEVDEQEAGGRLPQAENEEVEPIYFPGSLGAAASLLYQEEEEKDFGDDAQAAAKCPATNTLRAGDRGEMGLLTQAACAEELPTTAAWISSPSPADSSTSISSPGGGGGGVDLDASLATKFSCQAKRSPSSNPTTHTAQAPLARKPVAEPPPAASGVGMTPSGQPGVSAGDGSVPQTMERGPKAEGSSLVDSSAPGGRAFSMNTAGITEIPEGDGSHEHREEDDEHGGEGAEHAGKGDEHSGSGDESGSSERVVAETKDTQTEDDIDVAVRKANNAPQFLVRARPWATQLEHGFVPDDSAGESHVILSRRRVQEEE